MAADRNSHFGLVQRAASLQPTDFSRFLVPTLQREDAGEPLWQSVSLSLRGRRSVGASACAVRAVASSNAHFGDSPVRSYAA